jgi:hypothetical protein
MDVHGRHSMGYVQYLVSKGVSGTGAVEVVLGRPISLPADRVLLAKLQVPSRTTSVSPVRVAGQPNAIRKARSAAGGMIELQSAEVMVAALVNGNESGWNQLSAVLARLLVEAGSSSRKSEIESLRQQLERLKQKKKALISQLQNHLSHPPPPSAPAGVKTIWQNLLDQLQRSLAELEVELKAVLAKINALLAAESA